MFLGMDSPSVVGNADHVLQLVVALIIGVLAVWGYLAWSTSSKPSSKQFKEKQDKHPKNNFHSPHNHTRSSSTDGFHDDDEEGEEIILKGYKLNKLGQKTTYFHQELSDQEKALLGDCSPKKLEVQSEGALASAPSTGSAWNAKGTWEDKDLSVWAQNKLESSLADIRLLRDDNIQISVSRVHQISGDATITMIRGSKRYIMDYSVELEWKVSRIEVSNLLN